MSSDEAYRDPSILGGEAITRCHTCNNEGRGDPRDWHHYRHPYKGPWEPVSRPKSPNPGGVDTPLRVPFDPILRLALIRKGVITPDDLKAAEDEITVTSEVFNRVATVSADDNEVKGWGGDNDVPRRTPFSSG